MKRLQARLLLMATLLLVISSSIFSLSALRQFERDLPPEMIQTTAVIGQSVAAILDKAQHHGVPFDQMNGVDEFLDHVLQDNPGLMYALVTDNEHRVRYASGLAIEALSERIEPASGSLSLAGQEYFNSVIPLYGSQGRSGSLHLGEPANIVTQKVREMALDVLTVLLVAMLVALELLRFVFAFSAAAPARLLQDFLERIRARDCRHYLPNTRASGVAALNRPLNRLLEQLNQRAIALQQTLLAAPAQWREGLALPESWRFHGSGERDVLSSVSVDYVRWPFFLVIFADSLSLSFFPLFAEQFYSEEYGISREMVIGLPMSLFMFVWAISMPWAGSWCDRIGYQRAFAAGALTTTVGLLLTAVSQTLMDLLLWRSITALGYGIVFITAQSYIANNTPPAQRTLGMAIFLSSFFAGSLSGAAIGGILADRIGFQPTFALSAGLGLVAAWFVWRALAIGKRTAAPVARRSLGWLDFQMLLTDRRFVVITFLSAIPAKIVLTGFLYYLAPLYLIYIGSNQSATGRIMMLYGLGIILLSPLIARLADRIGRHSLLISLGGYTAALAMFVIYGYHNAIGTTIAVILLGVAHAIGVSPQLAMISDVCQTTVSRVGAGTATGIFRFIERLGNVLGPMLAGALIALYGFTGAFLGIGILLLLCASAFSLFFLWDRFGQRGRPL